jgi:DNA-binding SARP family transcriptional activator/Tfp pilus assembly protein PilF
VAEQETPVWFQLLGPLEARSDDAGLSVPAGRQRAVLAALLLRANRVVSVEDLIEVLWGAAPPPSARVAAQNYVKRLRDALGTDRDRIVTRSPGYTFRLRTDELDITCFEAEVEAARAAARAANWEIAAATAAAALSRWHGDPLADVGSEALARREVPRLTELRLQAAETRASAAIQLGWHADVISELRELVGGHPLRERLWVLLATALQRDGRQAEALAVYREARDLLIAEVGAEPGPELRDLHHRILAGEPGLPAPATAAAGLAPLVPRELPARVHHLIGRQRELAMLTEFTGQGRQDMPAVVISAIGGTAGVGKTALALAWAHDAADRFPDGQLYVNLRGYDADQPVSAADALAGLLRSLGVSGQDIPTETEDRARRYRTLLAGYRVLVLLDNARDVMQVRPLLPGTAGCAVLITSRDSLDGLAARDGGRRLDLDVLPLPDAVVLLRSLIGSQVDSDPDAAAELARLCAQLPLALRITAELAVSRPESSLRELAAELAASRLDSLDAGEDRSDVRVVFSWSVRHLPDETARAFALIGLHPGEYVDVHAVAALAGISTGQARQVLARLQRASLLQLNGHRYGMHDLLRAYARELAAAQYPGRDCDEALTRLFDFYRAAAAAAMDVLYPAEAHRRPRVDRAATVVPDMPGDAEARAWLDAERANLVAVVVHCVSQGRPRHATDLARTLFRYLMNGSHLPQATIIYDHALQAARASADIAAEAEALNGLGGIGIMKGRFREAADMYEAALERYRQCGDLTGRTRVLHNLGNIEMQLNNHQAAASYYRRAIGAAEDAGDSLGAVRALADLAAAETELGSYEEAAEHLRRALPVLRQAQDQFYEAEALERTGDLGLRRGRLAEAAGFFEQALALYRRLDHPTGLASALGSLGEVSLLRGEYERATSHLRRALDLFRETGNQFGEIRVLLNLARALDGTGQPDGARAELTAALRLAAETGNTYQQATAHRELGDGYFRAGEREQARDHWQRAVILYAQLGAPEEDQVRANLSDPEAGVPESAAPVAATVGPPPTRYGRSGR